MTSPGSPSTFPDALRMAAGRNPNHPALVMLDEALSYADLDRRSSQVANLLIEAGLEPGDRVGLYAHKSVELFIAVNGIMKAGGVFVPINPDSPASYLAEILESCEIRYLFAGRSTARVLRDAIRSSAVELCVGVDPLDDERTYMPWPEVWSVPAADPEVPIAGSDLAYIMFTSGSTGRPKGIMHTHSSGLAYGKAAVAAYGFDSHDRLANHAPLNFDLCLLELWGGLVAGATVVIIPEAYGRLPASFSEQLEDHAVTVVNAVPYALVQLLHRGALDERDLSALRLVAFGGEVFPTKDLRALMSRIPNARFVNVYGPAEVNGVTLHIVPTLPEDSDAPIPIGRLYQGMIGVVVDADDQEVGVGETGELLINSPTHMVGYWREPELTAKCTVHRSGKRWHRTGDYVHQDVDGVFHLVGRIDRMVKTRGHRVELDEVESVLNSHELVEQAVVFTVPDGEGSQQIEAAVILLDNGGVTVDADALKKHAASTLPRYAVPRRIRIVADVPRTTSGKADRVALAAQAASGGAGAEASRTEERT